MSRNNDASLALAGRAWQRMFEFLVTTSPQRSASLAKRGLTPNDSRALASLHRTDGKPIGMLAREWRTDPSNTTWAVDRLEKAGLAERRPDPDDRRVKLVVLTKKGERIQQELLAEFHAPPAQFKKLSDHDLKELDRILEKIAAEG